MFEIYHVFPTPVLKIKFHKHDQYIFKDLEKINNKPERWDCSVRTSFPNIPDEGDELIDSTTLTCLKEDLLTSIQITFKNLKISTDVKFLEFWYNAYWDNQGQEPHDHIPELGDWMPMWSGVYYNKNASPTIFNREGSYTHKIFSFAGCLDSEIRECYYTNWWPEVEDGDIILFPPYLSHYVNTGDEYKDKMRLTFSFNLAIDNDSSINYRPASRRT